MVQIKSLYGASKVVVNSNVLMLSFFDVSDAIRSARRVSNSSHKRRFVNRCGTSSLGP